MKKMIPAMKVHTHIVGSVEEFREESARRAAKAKREFNIRDVVGAAQCPTIGEVFGRAA